MLAAGPRFLSQSFMEGNLPAMDIHMRPTFHQDQSNEEMKQLLLCATLELQSVKAEERAHEAKLRHHEAQLRHLQDALFKVRKERDEYRDKCNQLQARLSRSPSLGSGLSDGITANLSNVQQQMESVSSMAEPTRATLSEVHRHLQEKHQQHLDFPHLEIQQHLHHQLDLPHHHMADLDLPPQENNHHMSSQQLEQLQQQLGMQQQDGQQLALDMHSPDRQSVSPQCTDGRNPGSANSSRARSDFSTGIQMKMHGSDQSCTLMDESIRFQMELTQGVSGSHLEQHSASLDFHEHLQQQQEQQMQMQLQLQQRQESELLLAHMQQRSASPSHLHHHADEQQLCHSRLSDGQDVGCSMLQQSGWQRTPQSCSVMQNGLSSSVTNMGTVTSFSMSSPPIPTGTVSSFSRSSPPIPSGTVASVSRCSPPIPSSTISSFSMSSPAIPAGTVTSFSMSTSPPVPTESVSSYSMSSPPVPSGHQANQLLQKGSAVASILSPLEKYGDSPSSNLLPPRPMHLPEPPEANAQVILSTLPEKGKLLQAVMQAGPLLQTLMVAGPLPQWRHPPPAMDSLEIPRVSMSTPSLPVPPSEHSSSVNAMCRNGSNLGHVVRMSTSSMHVSSSNVLCQAKSMPVSAISSDTFNSSPLNPNLSPQRSFPQRLPLPSSLLSHDMHLLGPPLKYAKIH